MCPPVKEWSLLLEMTTHQNQGDAGQQQRDVISSSSNGKLFDTLKPRTGSALATQLLAPSDIIELILTSLTSTVSWYRIVPYRHRHALGNSNEIRGCLWCDMQPDRWRRRMDTQLELQRLAVSRSEMHLFAEGLAHSTFQVLIDSSA